MVTPSFVAGCAICRTAPSATSRHCTVDSRSQSWARDALARFVAAGLVPEIGGSGFVIEQTPAAGQWLEEGSDARLVLGLAPPERAPAPAPLVAPGPTRVAGVSHSAARRVSEEF